MAPGYFPGTACYNNPSYAGSFYCSQFLTHQRLGYGGGALVPFFWGYPSENEPEAEPQATVPEPDNSLVSQVRALTDEVELLREEQALRQELPPRAATPNEANAEKPVATTFVYRDGHQLEAQNYAILGKTVWVFGDHSTRKIPLADLDLNATQKLNEDRGVDFVPPNGD